MSNKNQPEAYWEKIKGLKNSLKFEEINKQVDCIPLTPND